MAQSDSGIVSAPSLEMWRKREYECVPALIEGCPAMHLTFGIWQPGSPKALRATGRFLDQIGMKEGSIALLTVRSIWKEEVAETTLQASIALGIHLSARYTVFACYSFRMKVFVVQTTREPLIRQFPVSRCILLRELQPYPGDGF